MKISQIYKMLCELYGISHFMDIEHFLILNQNTEYDLTIGNRFGGREALIIKQSGEDLELGLFIDPSIVASIERGETMDHIDELSCAIEGVSHFLYVIDRAEKERRVSALELELQGEVDKFLLLHLIASDLSHDSSDELFEKQFEHHSYNSSLSPDEIERYKTANHFAAKYCAHLHTTYFNPLRRRGLIEESRDFFKRDLEAKVKRLIP